MYKIFIPWSAVFNVQFLAYTFSQKKLFRKILTKTKKYFEIYFHQNGKISIGDI